MIVVATPRTGSVLTFTILARYLRHKEDRLSLGEYFNPFHYNLWHHDGPPQRNLTSWEDGAYRNEYEVVDDLLFRGQYTKRKVVKAKPIEDWDVPRRSDEEETNRRIAMLAEAGPKNHTMHVHANPLPSTALRFIMANYTPVFVQRRDTLEQILSYGVAMHTKVWRSLTPGEAPVPGPRSVTLDRAIFDQQARRIIAYRRLRDRWSAMLSSPPAVVEYESLHAAEDKFGFVMDKIGVRDWREVVPQKETTHLPVKTGPERKLELFANADDILRWYNESALAEQDPGDGAAGGGQDGHSD